MPLVPGSLVLWQVRPRLLGGAKPGLASLSRKSARESPGHEQPSHAEVPGGASAGRLLASACMARQDDGLSLVGTLQARVTLMLYLLPACVRAILACVTAVFARKYVAQFFSELECDGEDAGSILLTSHCFLHAATISLVNLL